MYEGAHLHVVVLHVQNTLFKYPRDTPVQSCEYIYIFAFIYYILISFYFGRSMYFNIFNQPEHFCMLHLFRLVIESEHTRLQNIYENNSLN